MGEGKVCLQAEHDDDILCEIEVIYCASDCLTYISDKQQQTVSVHRWSDGLSSRVSLLSNGCTHIFEQADPLIVSTADGEGGDSLLAPMTGVIRLVDVTVGQSVHAGDRLLVMEAMKMETSLTAPRDAVVTAINCKPGSNVEGSSALISFGDD